MLLIDTQLTASQVLRTFHRDEPYLFLGAAFSTVALVAACFCLLRRRFDALLLCLAAFAWLYGQRLWLDAGILRLAIPDNLFFARLQDGVNYLVPIPGFLYFRFAGFLGRGGNKYILAPLIAFAALFLGTMVYGPLPVFHSINNGIVISAMCAMALTSLRSRDKDRDYAVMRWGLLLFSVLAIWDNVVSTRWLPKLEPYGFAMLLACLGYVAARRTIERDRHLGEIEQELDLARRIQLSLLPPAFPDSTQFRVAARYVPMTSVAGDLYDFLVADENHAGLLIADVSGHGVPAALIASMVKMAASSQRANAAEPAQLLTGMNAALCGNTQGQFVTAAYVYLDAESRELRYAAAGHPPMFLLRHGAVTEIAENGLLLAAVAGASFLQAVAAIEPGDRLLLYTDGLTEARNAQGKLFGEQALIAAFRETANAAPDEAADRIVASVQAWSRAQDDDLTLLICDYLAAPATK
jgi:sigma-B regulation protein RsbU (phosphoserine phosphatase)